MQAWFEFWPSVDSTHADTYDTKLTQHLANQSGNQFSPCLHHSICTDPDLIWKLVLLATTIHNILPTIETVHSDQVLIMIIM